MNRRDFVAGSVAVAAASGLAEAQPADRQDGNRDYYELRLLTFATRASLDRYALFLKEAFFPAIRRNVGESAGAFTVADKPDQLSLYLLVSYPSLSAYGSGESRLIADAEFCKAGAAVLDLPATDPPYTHAESSLMVAFASWPSLKSPQETAGDHPRIFELRTYESHSRKANLKKIEMFNQGEAALFARHGFQPVFFGETLAGPQIPNLTYMLTYPAIEARGEFWKVWGADPEKDRLFANPDYADRLIVSKIHQTFLKPLPGSMI
jgi:hypothetical protein